MLVIVILPGKVAMASLLVVKVTIMVPKADNVMLLWQCDSHKEKIYGSRVDGCGHLGPAPAGGC